MPFNARKKLIFAFFTGLVVVTYSLWLLIRPAQIVAVHEDGNHSYILVNHFPFTDSGKISWWLANQKELKDIYHIPKPASYGSFTIVFWSFGDGYKKEGKYDRFCFIDMATDVNCIEKDAVFSVSKSTNSGTRFVVGDNAYQLNSFNKPVKMKKTH